MTETLLLAGVALLFLGLYLREVAERNERLNRVRHVPSPLCLGIGHARHMVIWWSTPHKAWNVAVYENGRRLWDDTNEDYDEAVDAARAWMGRT